MRAGFRKVLPFWIALFAFFTASPLTAQQNTNSESSSPQSIEKRAISVVMKQNVLDPTALVKETGKPLPLNGKWQIGEQRPAICPPTTETCVQVLYEVPEDGISCQWVVALNGDDSDGTILQQNDDSRHYLLRRLPADQSANQVLKRKEPDYPPMAMAAHVAGPVLLRVFVSASGTPEKIFVMSGPEMLRASAAVAMQKWKFKPLMAGTQPVRFQTDVTFNFQTSGPGFSRVTSQP